MSMIVGQFLAWYLVVQLITLAALPLAWRLLGNLPDRGYAFARPLGILLSGYIFWLAYSYGLVRNERGAAWLAVIVLAAVSLWAGWPVLQTWRRTGVAPARGRAVLAVELVFLLGFAAWAWVRLHDPAASHTEKPMDLMFMNSIAASPTYPPQDAWLAGHPISYYYFGYWLLYTLGLLAGQPPALAYNIGQACWFGLLLSGSFAVVYSLLAVARRSFGAAVSGGVLGAVMVGMAANVQGILEWLHANGVGVGWIAGLLGVPGFPADAAVTGQWFVGFDWWWRSSRVIEDLSLAGAHIEVIDEFPAFSYLLGDNHPHVTAMPFVLLVIALALNLFLAPVTGGELATGVRKWWERVSTVPPWGVGGYVVLAIVLGSLIPLNTWDFPPYWLLVVVALAAALMRRGSAAAEDDADSLVRGERLRAIAAAGVMGIVLLVATWLLYLPYSLTAQSQASGIALNLFYPTHLGQFTAMFGIVLLTLVALIWIAWAAFRPRLPVVIACAVLVLGLPLLFLATGGWLSLNTDRGRALLAEVPLPEVPLPEVPLPEGADGHQRFMIERWLGSPYTFILTGLLLAIVVVLAWRAVTARRPDDAAEAASDANQNGMSSLAFVLVLAGLGLLWVFAPEIIYLRDNFGTRMNTIFKFYYQAWLLFGLAGAYTIVVALARPRLRLVGPAIMSGLALVLVAASLVYLGGGVYSKTGGFAGPPTFDAMAHLAASAPDEWNAVRWLQENTLPGDVVVEGKGRSYGADTNRASTMTGRATLLGWDGHEAQWRGRAYGEMAAGRPAALEAIYRDGAPAELRALFAEYGVDYVYVGPAERAHYGTTIQSEARLAPVADLVFSSGDVRIYRVR